MNVVVVIAWFALQALLAGQAIPPESVTFSRHIAPIIDTFCGQCHRPGGSAPFSLLTYAAARRHATQMAVVTRRRLMPPWKSEPGYGDFVGHARPSEEQIDLIQRWVDQGSVEGNPSDRPTIPTWVEGWRLGRPDVIVTVPEPYTLEAEGADVFRTFVVRLPVGGAQFVRGMEFRPGNPTVVHHANIRIDRTPSSRELDDEDPETGYDGPLARTALYPDGHFLGWTPGQVAPLLPKGLAWRLLPGTDLVLQLHMQPSGKREVVQPSVGLYFGSDPPERSTAMLRLGRQNIDIPAGEKHYVVTDSYVLPIDVDVQAVQPHAHYRAREIKGFATLPDGTIRSLIYIKDWDFRWQHLYRYVAPFTLPKATTLTMLYTYDNSTDNPRNPQHPPVRAPWGQRSSEEMGDLWIQVVAQDARDLERLNRDFRPKAVMEDLAGYESLIARGPRTAALHDDAALLCLEVGLNDKAVAHFEASARLKPGSPTVHFNLGTALTLTGRLDEAIVQFERAIGIKADYANAHNSLGNARAAQGRLEEAVRHYRDALRADPTHAPAENNLGRLLLQLGQAAEAIRHLEAALKQQPDYANAHNNLGTALASQGRFAEAIGHYRDALGIDAGHAQAHNNLGRMLVQAGQLKEAVGHFREALRIDPEYAEAYYNLGTTRRSEGDSAEAVRQIREAVRLKPAWVAALVDLSWILATSPEADVRDPIQAIALAERAAEVTARRDGSTLDVLGVAYAAAGRFEQAVAAAEAALAAGPPEALAADIRSRLARYRERKP